MFVKSKIGCMFVKSKIGCKCKTVLIKKVRLDVCL